MKEIIQAIIDGTAEHSVLEPALAEHHADANAPDNKVRGIYRLGVLLNSSPEKVKDAQFLDRFKQLTE